MNLFYRALGAFLKRAARPVEATSEQVASASTATPVRIRVRQDVSAQAETFQCDVDPGIDALRVSAATHSGGNAVAFSAAHANGPNVSTVHVVLSPARARRLAATVLNLADHADGTEPLVFFPPSDDEGALA